MWKRNFRIALYTLKNKITMAFGKITSENCFSPLLDDKSTVSSVNLCVTVIACDSSWQVRNQRKEIFLHFSPMNRYCWAYMECNLGTVFSRTMVCAVLFVTVHSYWALPLAINSGRSLGLVCVIHWSIACFHLDLAYFFFLFIPYITIEPKAQVHFNFTNLLHNKIFLYWYFHISIFTFKRSGPLKSNELETKSL